MMTSSEEAMPRPPGRRPGGAAADAREAISIKRAAYLLDVHEDTLKRWWKTGRIQLVRVGKKLLRVPASEIKRLRVESEDQSRPPATKTQGYVYLVESGGMIKIGVTCYLGDRIKVLQQQSAIPVSLRGTLNFLSYEEAQRSELALHQRFRDRRRHGEWFALSDAEVADILSGR